MATLEFAELEELYDRLANAIDDVGSDKESVFLAKLVLLLSRQIGDPKVLNAAISDARSHLD